MSTIGMIGLVRIELPDADVRLCDGGFIEFDGLNYFSAHETFGTIGSIEALEEGVGNEVPALSMELQPPGTAAVADLSQPGYQRSRARFWIGEFDVALGTLVGAPDLQFDGQIDQTTLRVGASRSLAMSVVSTAERLFQRSAGNSLNPSFHKSVWPGETGHDNATGLVIQGYWGTERPRGVSTGGASVPGWSGGGGRSSDIMVAYA